MLLTHATVTVNGDAAQLAACDARVKVLLAQQSVDGECADHHGATALCYELKVRGGIPFPAFALASLEFPDLKFSAEWVNAGAGTRGAATIANGQLIEHKVDALDNAAETGPPVYVRVACNGELELALTVHRANVDEWLGYCVDSNRDALFRVLRNGDQVNFYATDGSAEWSLQACDDGSALAPIAEPVAIDQQIYLELEQLAQQFAADWIWFSNGKHEDIAIEIDRYQRYGHAVHDANLRAAHLHTMKQATPESAPVLEFSTLSADDAWLKEVVERCWLKKN